MLVAAWPSAVVRMRRRGGLLARPGLLLLLAGAVGYLSLVGWLAVLEHREARACTSRGWHQVADPVTGQLRCVP